MNKPNWTNRTMFTGDNLDIMRGMNSESVDLIYLDPPFNSNRNYAAPIGSKAAGAAFKDTWTLDDVDLAWHGEIAEQHQSLYVIIDAAREAHGRGMQSYLIMMGVRLLEMRRLLKSTGSVYLHCDPTASHYLKLLMDAVIGAGNFRGHITWKRSLGSKVASRFYSDSDHILYYAYEGRTWNPQYRPLSQDVIDRWYRYRDEEGRRYNVGDLKGPSSGYEYEFLGVTRVWRYPEEKMHELVAKGRIVHKSLTPGSQRNVPGYKRYLDESKGATIGDVWTDIAVLNRSDKERTGYPTQKPLALLDRIVRASSNEGDTVLDPFCGCATACVAADRLDRQWAGIDLSPLAAQLVKNRIQTEGPLLYNLVHRTDIPNRTDVGKLPPYKTHKHTLFGQQEGICNGCRIFFPFQNFTIDHVVPQSKGGTDHIDNLQLLCNACNSKKGAGSQAELIVALRQEGIIN